MQHETINFTSPFFSYIATGYCQIAVEYVIKGVAKNYLQDYRGAIQDFSKALELNPLDTVIYVCWGFSKSELKDYTQAIQDYDKAKELNPKYADAYYLRGLAKLQLNDKNAGCLDLSNAEN